MSYEQSLVARVQPYMVAARARLIYEKEASKGCLPILAPAPVAIEPPFTPLWTPDDLLANEMQAPFTLQPPPAIDKLRRLRLWVPSTLECDWTRAEFLCKQLSALRYPATFEIWGNQKQIVISLLCHCEDEPIIHAAFGGAFPQCALSLLPASPIDALPPEPQHHLMFHDYWPLPPYSALMTRPSELRVSPFETLLFVLANIPEPSVGIYQVVFQPTAPNHAWHSNVEIMVDLEYAMKLFHNPHLQQQYAQQAPSGQLSSMANEVLTKSHNDKPFFAVAVRVAFLGSTPDSAPGIFRALTSPMSLFRHGGRALCSLSEADYYRRGLDPCRILELLDRGQTYRAGFLLNSAELASVCHIPPIAALQNLIPRGDVLKSSRVPPGVLDEGVTVGCLDYADDERPICILPTARMKHIHMAGRPGCGKSTEIEHLCLQDIERGDGVCVLDPHGDLAERLLHLIPPSRIDRVILFDLSDRTFLPLWNPLHVRPGEDRSRAADEIVTALKSIMSGWGDRLEHLLKHAVYGLLHLPDATLLDVANLLTPNSSERDRLCRRIAAQVDNEFSRRFFEHDLRTYGKDDLAPPQHKLSKLLLADPLSLVLSQPEDRFDFRQMMDAGGQIFIGNLASIGPVRNLLGCLLIALLHLAAISRSDTPEHKRPPFHLYIDEAHRFLKSGIEDLFVEMRKFQVSTTLVHHYMSQFDSDQADALRQAETTIVFNEPEDEARSLARLLGGQVQAEDLTTLGLGEAVVRVGTQVARIRTPGPRPIPANSPRDRIVELSRQRYYKSRQEIEDLIQRRGALGSRRVLTLPLDAAGNESYEYDEL